MISVDIDEILIQGSPVLSSEVGDILFQSDKDFAEIEISYGNSVFFSTNLAVTDGYCCLFDPGEIIAQWMKSNRKSVAQFSISDVSDGSAANIKVILCSCLNPGIANLSLFTAVSSDFQIVSSSFGEAHLHLYSSSDRSVSMKITGLSAAGDIINQTVQIYEYEVKDSVIRSYSFSVQQIKVWYNEMIDDESDQDLIIQSVVCAKFYTGERLLFTVYPNNDPDLVGFSFANVFGLSESVFLHADVTPEIKIDEQSAVLGFRKIAYDREISQSFKVSASNISERDWPRIKQFLISDEIFELKSGKRVIISDISSSVGKSDELGSLSFSYRFDDSRLLS